MKKGFKGPELLDSAKNFNQRNRAKMESLINQIEENGGLTSAEKEAIDKFAYAKVTGDINQGYASCENLKNRINNGEWDY